MYLDQFSLLRPSTMQHKRSSRCLERSLQISEEVEASGVNHPQSLGKDTDDMGGSKTHFKVGRYSCMPPLCDCTFPFLPCDSVAASELDVLSL